MSPKPPVGMPCQYFRSSDRPAAAQITAIDNMGMFVLRVTPSEGQPFNQRFVYHKDDPLLQDRPADWRAQYGVWDYLPGFPRYDEPAVEAPVENKVSQEPSIVVPPAQPPQPPQRQQPTGPLQRSGK